MVGPGRDALLARGIRWRLGASLLTMLTATVAVAAAVLGPLYLHAAGDTVVRRAVADAPVPTRGVTLLPRTSAPVSPAAMARASALVAADVGEGRTEAPIVTVDASAAVPDPGNPDLDSGLLARTGICAHLRIVAGGCDLRGRDAVLTTRVARAIHAHVGSVVDVAVDGGSRPLTVAGIATVDIDAPYWWGDGPSYFPNESGAGSSKESDSVVVSPSTVLGLPTAALATTSVDIPLRPDAVDLADSSRVLGGLARDAATLRERQIVLSTGLPGLVAAADHQRHAMATIVVIAAIQLVLLAVWVLAGVLARSADARRAEARVARLRGFAPASVVWVTSAEPAALCAIGAGLGIALAFAATFAARSSLLVPRASVRFDLPAALALAAVLLAIAVALGVGAFRLARSTSLDAVASSATRRGSTWTVAVDAILVVLAVVALVALSTSGALQGHTDPVAAAAPGLIALGGAVVAVAVVTLLCRAGTRLSADSPRLAPFLALRQTSRRPGVLRQARVLVIALCLACFATAAWSVGRDNRATVAHFAVGADRVVSLAPTSAADLQHAVDRADPQGRWAMATVQIVTQSTRLLAVQTGRLRAVAAWPAAISRTGVRRAAADLAPAAAPAVDLPTGLVRISASAAGSTLPHLADVELAAWVFSPSGGTAVVGLGVLRPGTATYGADLAAECPAGCRLSGLGIVPAPGRRPPSDGSATLAIESVTAGAAARPVDADLRAGGWRAQSGVALGADGLRFRADASAIAGLSGATSGASAPMVSVADHPSTLPAVITSEVARINSGAVGALLTSGLDGQTVDVRPVAVASALPRLGADAMLVSLPLLARSQTLPTAPGTVAEVFVGDHAPRDAIARLRAVGLVPTGIQRAATAFAAQQRTAPALADDFLLIAAAAALVIAAASTLAALGATTRQRATELTALRIAGVPRGTLVRSLAMETGILLVTAASGAGAGVLAALLAVRSLPELAAPTVAPLSYALSAGPIVVVGAVVLAVVALAGAIIAAVLTRRMSPTLLRTAPDDVAG